MKSQNSNLREILKRIKASFEEISLEATKSQTLKQIQKELGDKAEIVNNQYVCVFDKNNQQYTIDPDRKVSKTSKRIRPKSFDGSAEIKDGIIYQDGKELGKAYIGVEVDEIKYDYSRGTTSQTSGIEYEELLRRIKE